MAFLFLQLPFCASQSIQKLSGPIANCFAYGESYDLKSMESCDQCENGYLMSDDELRCDQSTSNCQALDGEINSQCWSCEEGFMISETNSGSLDIRLICEYFKGF